MNSRVAFVFTGFHHIDVVPRDQFPIVGSHRCVWMRLPAASRLFSDLTAIAVNRAPSAPSIARA